MNKNSTLLGSPRTLLALLAGAAIVVAALLVVLSQLGGTGSSASNVGVAKLYSGIPQDGTILGESSAPVTIYLYEDFQCPICGQFNQETFPELVSRDVRDGKVKMAILLAALRESGRREQRLCDGRLSTRPGPGYPRSRRERVECRPERERLQLRASGRPVKGPG